MHDCIRHLFSPSAFWRVDLTWWMTTKGFVVGLRQEWWEKSAHVSVNQRSPGHSCICIQSRWWIWDNFFYPTRPVRCAVLKSTQKGKMFRPRQELEIWQQRSRYFAAAAVAVHCGWGYTNSEGDDKSEGEVTSWLVTWLAIGGGGWQGGGSEGLVTRQTLSAPIPLCAFLLVAKETTQRAFNSGASCTTPQQEHYCCWWRQFLTLHNLRIL